MSFSYDSGDTFKVGDRAIVTGPGGLDGHVRNWIVPGTDVEVVSNAESDYVSVRGLCDWSGGITDEVNTQWVHPDDLEPFVELYDGVVLPETLDGSWIDIGSVDETTTGRRADALRTAIDILGGVSDDIGDLIDVAEWLYSGHTGRGSA